MRDCPKCNEPVDGFSCKCGWKDPEQKAIDDRMRYLCAYEERGQRCGNLGTMTENTLGPGPGNSGPHPGPWWCHQHFPPFARGGNVPVDPNRIQHLRDAVARSRFPRPVMETIEDNEVPF